MKSCVHKLICLVVPVLVFCVHVSFSLKLQDTRFFTLKWSESVLCTLTSLFSFSLNAIAIPTNCPAHYLLSMAYLSCSPAVSVDVHKFSLPKSLKRLGTTLQLLPCPPSFNLLLFTLGPKLPRCLELINS